MNLSPLVFDCREPRLRRMLDAEAFEESLGVGGIAELGFAEM